MQLDHQALDMERSPQTLWSNKEGRILEWAGVIRRFGASSELGGISGYGAGAKWGQVNLGVRGRLVSVSIGQELWMRGQEQ